MGESLIDLSTSGKKRWKFSMVSITKSSGRAVHFLFKKKNSVERNFLIKIQCFNGSELNGLPAIPFTSSPLRQALFLGKEGEVYRRVFTGIEEALIWK